MLTIFFIIGIILIILGVVFKRINGWDEAQEMAFIMPGILLLLTIIPITIGLVLITGESRIDAQIEVCEQENQKFESAINIVVKDYLDHEQITYSEMTNDIATTWVSILPELQSNEVIIKQMNIIQENNAAIRNLKNDKINLGIWRFLIYFGK